MPLNKLYQDWGKNLKKKSRPRTAVEYLNKSLQMKKNNTTALLARSYAKLNIADVDGALKDATTARKLKPNDVSIDLQECDCLYELNQFEKNKIALSNKLRNYNGVHEVPFKERLITMEANYDDILGKNAGPCLLNMRNTFSKLQAGKNELGMDDRPTWKILRDLEQCDAVSIRTVERKSQHILEKVHSKQTKKTFSQKYFHNGWHDIEFLESLKTDKRLILKQTPVSSETFKDICNYSCNQVQRSLKMLQARQPIYTKTHKMCPDETIRLENKNVHLNRVQCQTRRDVFNQLDQINELRAKGDLTKLVNYVEKVMGQYYEIKTNRIMPRKFEFINEIYNILALAYLDKLKTPSNFFETDQSNKMFALLRIPIEKEKLEVKPIFGDKSTFKVPDEPDYVYLAYKKITTKLENRLPHTKYPIERCYLYHEIAKHHLSQSKVDEAKLIAKKVLIEAEKISNSAWLILGILIIVKADTIQRNCDKIRLSLIGLRTIIYHLNDSVLEQFIETLIYINTFDIENKKESKERITENEEENSSLINFVKLYEEDNFPQEQSIESIKTDSIN